MFLRGLSALYFPWSYAMLLSHHLPITQCFLKHSRTKLTYLLLLPWNVQKPIPLGLSLALQHIQCDVILIVEVIALTNDDKTEVRVIITPNSASKHSLTDIVIGDSILQPTAVARNIGMMFDSELGINSHVSKLCQVAYFHLHRIRSIRDCLTQHVTELLVHSLVLSRLDYGNGLLIMYLISYWTSCRVQNMAARIVVRASRYDNITSILETLHWLPVRYRIEYKVVLMTFKALHLLVPSYIAYLLQFYQHVAIFTRFSSDCTQCISHHYGDLVFCIAVPRLWNSLPHEMRKCDSLYTFKRFLKTILFKCAYYS